MSEVGTLKEFTADIHRMCERHPVGSLLSAGTVNAQQYADWVGVQHAVHTRIDPLIDERLRRAPHLAKDLEVLEREHDVRPRGSELAPGFLKTLRSQESADAACYVIVGAHLMGGSLIAQRLGDRLPHNHVPKGEERKEMLRAWEPLRERGELGDEAVRIFGALFSALEEIRIDDEDGKRG